jgi:hypothetical protein
VFLKQNGSRESGKLKRSRRSRLLLPDLVDRVIIRPLGPLPSLQDTSSLGAIRDAWFSLGKEVEIGLFTCAASFAQGDP